MSLISASVRELTNARAMDVALVDGSGDQLTGFDGSRPANAALTSVAYAAGSLIALAANSARRGAYLFNSTNKTIFVALDSTASLTTFSFAIPSNVGQEMPLNGYTGDIAVIWQSAPAGGPTLHVTELLA